MKTSFLFSLLALLFLPGFSQPDLSTSNPQSMDPKPILGLRTCIYMVGDLDEAKAWYAKAFGVEPYFDEPFYVGFDIGGYELGLLPEENPNTEKAETVLTYWGVEEIEKVYAHFIASGATEHEKPHSVGDPLMVATVRDPWGNLIGLIYNPVFRVKP
jgi:lactoylglutathione lyase